MSRKSRFFDMGELAYKIPDHMGHIPNKSEAKLLRKLQAKTGLTEEEVRSRKKYRKMLSQAAKKSETKHSNGKSKGGFEKSITRTTGLPIEHPLSKLEWNKRIMNKGQYLRPCSNPLKKKHFTKNDIKYLKEKKMTYKQCDIKYDDNVQDTVWVDSKVAKKGNRIEDKDVGKRGHILVVYQNQELTEPELKETQRLARKFDNNI